MKTDIVLDIKSRGSELPDRSIEFLDSEACRSHGVQEVVPGDLIDLVGCSWRVEESAKNFKSSLTYGEGWLEVLLHACGRFWGCGVGFLRNRCVFCFWFDLFVGLGPVGSGFGLS